MINWVVCRGNSGYLVNNGLRERRKTAFDKDAIGQVKNIQGEEYEVWLIGCNQTFLVPSNEVEYIDITQTGDRFNYKICNVCHCLKPIANFDKNQNNKRGVVRRPSCTQDKAIIGGLSSKVLIIVDTTAQPVKEIQRIDMKERIRGLQQAKDGSIWVIEDGKHADLIQLVKP